MIKRVLTFLGRILGFYVTGDLIPEEGSLSIKRLDGCLLLPVGQLSYFPLLCQDHPFDGPGSVLQPLLWVV